MEVGTTMAVKWAFFEATCTSVSLKGVVVPTRNIFSSRYFFNYSKKHLPTIHLGGLINLYAKRMNRSGGYITGPMLFKPLNLSSLNAKQSRDRLLDQFTQGMGKRKIFYIAALGKQSNHTVWGSVSEFPRLTRSGCEDLYKLGKLRFISFLFPFCPSVWKRVISVHIWVMKVVWFPREMVSFETALLGQAEVTSMSLGEKNAITTMSKTLTKSLSLQMS